MQWKDASSPSPWKFKVQASAGKIMCTKIMCWMYIADWLYASESDNYRGFNYYADLLHKLCLAIKEKRRGKLTQVPLLLHDNAPAHRSTDPTHHPNVIQIESALLPQYSRQTDRPTDRPTDGQFSVGSYASHLHWTEMDSGPASWVWFSFRCDEMSYMNAPLQISPLIALTASEFITTFALERGC